MADKNFKVKTGLDLPSPLPAEEGGTGQTSLSNLLNALLPVQTSASGKMLSSDGTNPEWAAVPNEIVYSSTAPSSPVTGQVWINTAATTQSFDPNLIRRSTFVSTAGQTEYTVSNAFVDGYEQVFFNGVLLQKTTDYTTSGGTTITLVTAAEVNDLVEVLSITNLNSTNTYTQAEISSTYAPKANPTFTGTVAGITKSMVSLGNVDNTSDANKPVSTATQTALDLKANKGAFNYVQTLGTRVTTVSGASSAIVSATITTNGYPVQIIVTGDAENNGAGAWARLQLFRGTTAIGNKVHVEGSAGSENIPFTLQFIDSQVAGTYTYSLKTIDTAGGSFNFGESDGPTITVLELGR